MEKIGAPEQPTIPSAAADRAGFARGPRPWQGWPLAAAITALAYALQHIPFPPFRVVLESGEVRHPVGPAIIAIVLGIAVRNLLTVPEPFIAGSRSLVRWSIPWAIVLVGAGLNLAVVAAIGPATIAIIISAILIALGVGMLAGRALRLGGGSSLLLASGTAICGNSAILAVAPLIKSRERDIVVAIAVVNLIGLSFMLALPALGSFAGLSPQAFGIWAGASIHSVPQAVAAGFAYPEAGAGEVATLAKLFRVAMLVPLVLAVTLLAARANGGLRSMSLGRLVPWFIWGFLALAAINTFVHGSDAMPRDLAALMAESLAWLNALGAVLLTLSLAAIGLDSDLRQLTSVGKSAFVAGLIASVAMAAGCFALIAVLI